MELNEIRTLLPATKHVMLLGLVYLVLKAIHYIVIKPLTSPLRLLQCPPGGKGALGHWPDMMDYYNGNTIDSWIQTFGPTFMVRGPYYVHHRLFTLDPRAITHVMNHPYMYEKPLILRRVLKRYMEEGLIVAEGHRHKVQRKIVQRLFSRNAMKDMTEIIVDKATQLRDIYTDVLNNPTTAPSYPFLSHHNSPPGTRAIDIYGAASRVMYDIIGRIAIDHTFDSLGKPHGPGGELFEKYEKMQQRVYGSQGLRQELSVIIPGLDKISPTENAIRVDAAMKPLEELAKLKIAKRRKEVTEGKRSDSRDLLSLMVRANMSNDVAPEWKMYDSEISGQLSTMVFAGSDTTAGTISWGLYHLACNPTIQAQLRAEFLRYSETLPFDQMDALPFLDATMKEMLRMNPAIPNTIRIATQDDVIPLATPIIDAKGKTISEVKIRKGQMIHIPIENLNMAPSLWGPDSRVFNPSRWLDGDHVDTSPSLIIPTIPTHSIHPKKPASPTIANAKRRVSADSSIGPGVWPNIMTFIDGPRRCVGYKLAMMECKIMLFTLIREFTFEPVEGKRVWKWNLFSTRPYVGGELATTGTSLPLIVKAYKV